MADDLAPEPQDPPDAPLPAKQPVHVRCVPCGHVWVAAYWPMKAADFVKVLSGAKHCPMCASKEIVMGGDEPALSTTVQQRPSIITGRR